MWLLDVLLFLLVVCYASAQTKPVISQFGVVPVVQGNNLTQVGLNGPDNVYLYPSTSSYSMTEGDTMGTITCSATCNPACAYTWSRSGSTVSYAATLDLSEVERMEAGSYVCMARNPGSNVSKSGQIVNVTVRYGPDNVSISPATTSYMVKEGDNLAVITCSAICYPACTYTWSRSWVRISSTATLVLSEIERREAGSYICTARNPDSSVSKNGPVVRVYVTYGPYMVSVSPSTTLYSVTEGNNLAAITCSATCNPACTYTWSRSGSRVSSQATLYLRQIQPREAGSYICTVLNPESSISKNGPDVRVDVIYGPDKVSLSPSTTLYSVAEGNNIAAITCYAKCNPDCTYTWSKSGSRVSSTATLYLRQIERREDGSYICTVLNPESSISKNGPDVRVYVIYGPDTVFINPSQTSYTMTEGLTMEVIYCYANCNPPCVYTWSRSGRTVRSNNTLNLGEVERGEAGSYVCTAKNPGSAFSRSGPAVNVTVKYGPSSLMLSPSTLRYIKNEGDTLGEITCSADCFPECNIRWQRTSGVSLNVVSYNAYMSIGKLDRSKRGSYRCEAINPDTRSKTTNTVTVDVRYGPDDVTLNVPHIHTVTEGDTVKNIYCSADCWPGCVFTWSNMTKKQQVSSSTVLEFRTAHRYDAGDYKCLAKNSAHQFSGEAEQHFTLIVQYSPDVVISQSSAFLNENAPLDLLCKATGVPAVYNYTGFLQRVNDIVVPNSHVGRPGLRDSISVNIPALRLQDTGVYTCYVHNGIIGHNKQLLQTVSRKVEVQASPRFLLDGTNFAGETSGNITIAIPFISIPEFTSYNVLRHDGQAVSTNGKCSLHIRNESVHPLFYGQRVKLTGNVLEIIIRDLSEKDFGKYKMQITNDINTANFSIDVKATSRPSQPTELNLTTLDNIVTFDWNKGFNGGYEQTFVLQTSLNSDGSWKNETVINESDAKYIKGNGRFQVHLTNLVPGIYSARLLAFNVIGAADPVEFKEQFKINEVNKEKQTSIPEAMIGGTAGGGICVIVLVIVVVIIFLRKRKTQKGQDDSDLTNGQKLDNLSHRTQPEDDNIPDEVENPMYVSGDDVDIPKVTTADIYATPDKKKSKQNEGAGDIYAVVDKKKKTKNKGNITGIYGNR